MCAAGWQPSGVLDRVDAALSAPAAHATPIDAGLPILISGAMPLDLRFLPPDEFDKVYFYRALTLVILMARRYRSWSECIAFLNITLTNGKRVHTMVESAALEFPAGKRDLARAPQRICRGKGRCRRFRPATNSATLRPSSDCTRSDDLMSARA